MDTLDSTSKIIYPGESRQRDFVCYATRHSPFKLDSGCLALDLLLS